MKTPRPTTPLGAAIALADLGWSVCPLHHPVSGRCSCAEPEACESPGKHPRTRNGLHAASRDFERIEKWFSRWPAANLGVRTGEVSGVWVLDIDGAEGAATMAELPDLPPSVEAKTGRGVHVYFRLPDGVDIRNSAGKIGAGGDVRGTDGYVIAPPSLHASGRRYRWVRDPYNHAILDAPDWLVDMVVPKPVPETFPLPSNSPDSYGARYIAAAIEAECAELARTPKGGRNHQLNSSAYALARFVADGRIDAPTVARSLAYAASRAGLGGREIEKTVRSAFRARGAA